ncbi:Holliday junction branch migration protein RuvA [Anaeroselena agilis]|uniref:Holliday junction branch migration complex subunit RuvA n=1 Tax=Anaeroselena agilis TaxID=3063788 RepID=A0ABU3NW18_9FIRM|nr:Holliday junction branch migration protein RuvA [Selenomonadales bacterium 4137-cl]
MIGYLKGTVTHLYNEHCFLDVQGVGYRVFIPASTRQQLAAGSAVTLFTHLNVREDAMLLYGFITTDEYELFQHLITITGVGPKVALGVLSAISPAEFRAAVSQKNAALLTRIPGIGKKTAERLILELKDKLGLPEGFSPVAGKAGLAAEIPQDARQEAAQALVALGYSQSEVGSVLQRIESDGQSAEEMIKLALKEFARR